MSDTPLFQGADEQEAAFAPQQLPAEDASQTTGDSDASDAANTDRAGAVPVPAAGLMGVSLGMGGTGASGGAAGGIGPAIGAAALANETEDEDASDR